LIFRFKRRLRNLSTPRTFTYGLWSIEIDLLYLRFQTQTFNEALVHFVKGGRNENDNSINFKNCLLSLWFNIGTLITLLLILPSIYILLHNINNSSLPSYYHGVSAANIPSGVVNDVVEKHASVQDKLSFQVVLPGVTLPMSDIGYYMMALLFCSAVHEAGHAISAVQEGIPLLNCGFILVLWFLPAAFVSLSTSELDELGAWRRLKIFSAGVWHNLTLAAIAYVGLVYVIPMLFAPLFQNGSGVVVKDVKVNSPVQGKTGLNLGNVIYEMNGCNVASRTDWRSCIIENMNLEENKNKDIGWCMEFKSAFVAQQSNYTSFSNISLNDDCCKSKHQNDDPSNLCFRTIHPITTSLELPETAKFSTCIPARESLKNSPSYCFQTSKQSTLIDNINPKLTNLCSNMKLTDEYHSFHCMKPSTDALLQVKRKEFDKQTGKIETLSNDFLFVGNPAQVYEDVIISNYIPRYWAIRESEAGWSEWSLWILSAIPEIAERSFYYVVAFSSALAVLNAVPCLKLDGQHIVKCFIIDLQIPLLNAKDNVPSRTSSFGPRIKVNQWRKTFAKFLTIFGTVLLSLNVILGCSKSFGF